MNTLISVTVLALLAAGAATSAGPGAQSVGAPSVSDGPSATRPVSSVVTEPELSGTYWIIESVVRGSTTRPLPADLGPYLIVDDSGQLEAYNGCNWINSTAQIDADVLTLSGTGTTKRACGGYPIILEIEVFAALDDGEVSYQIDDGRLELSRPDGPGLRLRSAP